MADELDLNLETLDEQINNTNKVEQRIKDLSGKAKTFAEERDAEKARAEKAEADRVIAEKERDFFKDFSKSTAKYPGAADFQDKIWEKVKSGYTAEDAAVSVLNAEGKLTATAVTVERESAAGGSSATQLSSKSQKTWAEMSQAERREKLIEAEKAGEISFS